MIAVSFGDSAGITISVPRWEREAGSASDEAVAAMTERYGLDS